MKVIVLGEQARFETYTDFSQVPSHWKLLYAAGMTDDQIIDTAGDAALMIADPVRKVSGYLIEHLPNLKIIQSEGVAFNLIDLEAAQRRGIYVCNNASANSAAVAEQIILLILALQRRLYEGSRMVFEGRQAEAKQRFILDGIMELGECTVGIVGLGSIGKALAKRLDAFDTKILYYKRNRLPQEEEINMNVCWRELPQLLEESDVICICLPVTKETVNYVDAEFLNQMKPNALLINAARGEIMDQAALAKALKENRIGGAGIDTLSPEPFTLDNPLLMLQEEVREKKLIISPHIAGTTYHVFKRMHYNCWNNLKRVAEGKIPKDIVSGL